MPYSSVSEVPDHVPKSKRKQWIEVWNSEYAQQKKKGKSNEEAESIAFAAANSVTSKSEGGAMDELKLLKALDYFRWVEKSDGTHVVEGIATSEAVDKDGEIADFKDTAQAIKVWSDEAAESTKAAGQEISLGNIRIQHDAKQIGGKVTAVEPNKAKKFILIATQPLEKVFDDLIKPGMVRGFSIAGSYQYRKCATCESEIQGRSRYCTNCKKDVHVRYAPNISEISYVDNPCNEDSTFTSVKADGSMEVVKVSSLRKEEENAASAFSNCKCSCINCMAGNHEKCTMPGCDYGGKDKAADGSIRKAVESVLIDAGLMKEKKTKRVAGKDLPASAFAYVGDPDDTSTWKLPIHDASHCRNALARFNQTQGIPAGEKAKVKAKIVARAKRFGIKVSEDSKKCVRAALVRVMAEQSDKAAAEQMVATVEEVFAKVDGEAKLFKGLYTVSQLAELLQSLQYLVASTEYERDYEGDDSEVPDDLRQMLEDLVPIFVRMAQEEASELLTQSKKAADGGKGGKSMSDQNADLLKAAKELMASVWKKAKSLFHKCATAHKGLMKAHESRGDHHKALSEHHADMSEAHADADKAVKDELQKLTAGSEFSKLDPVAKIEAKVAVLEKSSNPHVKGHAKIAKAHMGLHKCAMKAHGHHDELHKAHTDLGDAEQAPDVEGRSKDDAEAHPGGSSEKLAQELKETQEALAKAKEAAEKGGNAELVKLITAGQEAMAKQFEAIKADVAAIKKDVDENLSQLDEGPVAKAKRLAARRDGTVNDPDGNKDDKTNVLAMPHSGPIAKVGGLGL